MLQITTIIQKKVIQTINNKDMAEKVIYAMYDDDDVLKDGAKKLVAKGVKISEVFSPFPIHGIDPIIGVKNTRLAFQLLLSLQYYVLLMVWRLPIC